VIVKTRLKEQLKNQGRTNKFLAQKLGKSENIVSLYVNAKANIPLPEVYKICSLLNIKIEDLLHPVKQIINE
jgi:DNA-binding Xre family transcriptional regulator